MGDVAMTVPVVFSYAQMYPETEFVVLSRANFAPLYAFAPANVHFLGVDLEQYAGLAGLSLLYDELAAYNFDAVADLHNVLRTRYLDFKFRMHSKTVAVIDKGRNDKRKLVSKKHKTMCQLPTSFERYSDVFKRLGLSAPLNFRSIFPDKSVIPDTLNNPIFMEKNQDCWIGFAPFAKHKEKIYPVWRMERVIDHFSHIQNVKIFLFGGGPQETPILQRWENLFANTISCAGILTMEQELMLMSRLDVMVSMDSANMHMASLVATPVVSIWGATHPYAGFMGWQQTAENAVQIDLPCRPCSVFGDKPCYRGDYACMSKIEHERVIEKINAVLVHSKI